MPDDSKLETIPVGRLGIIAMESCTELGNQVDNYLVKWRAARQNEHKSTIAFHGYERDSYLIDSSCPRFGSGEAKGVIRESVRGTDLYILVDVLNHSLKYKINGEPSSMSPDDH